MRQFSRMPLVFCLAALVAVAACRGGTDRAADTPRTEGVRVTDVTLGRAIGGDKAITDRTETFKPNDTIYASVRTDGTAERVTLRARWTFEGGQVVDESSRTISPRGEERTEFSISKPDGWPAGKYRLEVFVNDQSAQSKDFQVRS
ncbi:hypothetical protein BH23ACI1_BH23ACI1_23170 [soil metagenome]|nr:hypothetical protein [Acidobacteriota bacterium]